MILECWFYMFRGIYRHLINAQEQIYSRFVQNVKLVKPTFSTRRGDTRTTAWACATCLLFENLLPVASYSRRISDLKVPNGCWIDDGYYWDLLISSRQLLIFFLSFLSRISSDFVVLLRWALIRMLGRKKRNLKAGVEPATSGSQLPAHDLIRTTADYITVHIEI